MKDLFFEEPDHNCIDVLLKQKSTLVLTIQIKKDFSKKSTIIAFALITQVKKGKLTVLIIVDYFGVTEMCPRHIIPTFDYERFRGKGIGKFIIHMIQAIANMLCESKDGKVLLKCNKDVSTFYETIGFERIYYDNDVMKLENVIQHYKELKLNKNLFSYLLKSSTKINHKANMFVNHVEQSLKDVDFSSGRLTSIVSDVHNIFLSPKKFDQMKESTFGNLKRSQFVFIPIGKIIQELFVKQKATEYYNFLRMYETIVSNINWVLQPEFEEKKKPFCYVCMECNLCGEPFYDEDIGFYYGKNWMKIPIKNG